MNGDQLQMTARAWSDDADDPARAYLEWRLDEARDRLAAAPPGTVVWLEAEGAVRHLELILDRSWAATAR